MKEGKDFLNKILKRLIHDISPLLYRLNSKNVLKLTSFISPLLLSILYFIKAIDKNIIYSHKRVL